MEITVFSCPKCGSRYYNHPVGRGYICKSYKDSYTCGQEWAEQDCMIVNPEVISVLMAIRAFVLISKQHRLDIQSVISKYVARSYEYNEKIKDLTRVIELLDL